MRSAKLYRHARQRLGQCKQCALSRGYVSIRDWEKPRYTIDVYSMRGVGFAQWTGNGIFVVPFWLDHWSPVLMLVMPVHSVDSTALLALAYHSVTRPPRIDDSILRDLCLLFPPLASAIANLSQSSLSSLATTYRRLHCLPLCLVNLAALYVEKFSRSLRGSLWVIELNPRYIPRPRVEKAGLTLSFSVEI